MTWKTRSMTRECREVWSGARLRTRTRRTRRFEGRWTSRLRACRSRARDVRWRRERQEGVHRFWEFEWAGVDRAANDVLERYVRGLATDGTNVGETSRALALRRFTTHSR